MIIYMTDKDSFKFHDILIDIFFARLAPEAETPLQRRCFGYDSKLYLVMRIHVELSFHCHYSHVYFDPKW